MIKFIANSNIIVSGATSSGKTSAILRIFKERLIEPFPEHIYYLYGAFQEFMETWNSDKSNPHIEFIDGLKLDCIDEVTGSKALIIDDLSLSQNADLTNHFLRGSHHKQCTTFYITHSIFMNDDNFRILSNNAHYIMIFKNRRNQAQVSRLANQVFAGDESKRITDAYKYSSLQPFGFILLSFHPRIPNEYTVISDFFSECPKVFL